MRLPAAATTASAAKAMGSEVASRLVSSASGATAVSGAADTSDSVPPVTVVTPVSDNRPASMRPPAAAFTVPSTRSRAPVAPPPRPDAAGQRQFATRRDRHRAAEAVAFVQGGDALRR